MVQRNLAMALALLYTFIDAQKFDQPSRIPCGTDSYACGDNSRCVKGRGLCDQNKDCDDLSDESLSLCKIFHAKRGGCSIPGELFHPEYRCRSIVDICSPDYHYKPENVEMFRTLCDEIKHGLKPNEDFAANTKEISTLREQISTMEGQSSYLEVFESVARGFSSCPEKHSGCPMLYGKISRNSRCVALFSLAKVTWSEAKQFCESIAGTLAILNSTNDYMELLAHFKDQGLTTDFWIGGHYVDPKSPGGTSGWKWLNEQDIKMGVPFWSLYQTSTCSTRGAAPACYTYSLAPRENRDGFCLALDYAFHYYFVDQNCYKKKSPLCFLNEK